MRTPVETRRKIARDAAISLLLYAAPVLLMLASFYISGKRPWLKTEPSLVHEKTNAK